MITTFTFDSLGKEDVPSDGPLRIEGSHCRRRVLSIDIHCLTFPAGDEQVAQDCADAWY